MPKPTYQRSWKLWVKHPQLEQQHNSLTTSLENLVQRHAHHAHQTEIHTVSGTRRILPSLMLKPRIQSETEELEGEIALLTEQLEILS